MISFACISPHPPILLPKAGSVEDRLKVSRTIKSLEKLGQQLAEINPDTIIISSPHPDWGIEVPLHFLISNDKYQMTNQFQISEACFSRSESFEISNDKFQINIFKNGFEDSKIFPILTSSESPLWHYQLGEKIAQAIPQKFRWAWIASGDMSHRLKEDGPYGLHPSGPKFDQKFIELLKKKDIEGILNLDPQLIEEAGECGLRSFCMMLGALEASKMKWQPEILSYEGPFGVGYLVTRLV